MQPLHGDPFRSVPNRRTEPPIPSQPPSGTESRENLSGYEVQLDCATALRHYAVSEPQGLLAGQLTFSECGLPGAN